MGKRREIYYSAFTLGDDTVMHAGQVSRSGRERGDSDGVVREHPTSGHDFRGLPDIAVARNLIVIATHIDVRRALRELVLPLLDDLRQELASLHAEVTSLPEQLHGGAPPHQT